MTFWPNVGGLNTTSVNIPVARGIAGIENGLDIAITFAADGVPYPAPDLDFTVTDIDGKNTESLHLMDTSNYATTVIDPTYLEGDGTALNPWSVLASGGSAPNNRNGSKGNIDIQGIVPASSVGMVYFLNTDVSRGSGSSANRMFIADLSFSATCVD